MADTLREHLEYLTLKGRTRLFKQAVSQAISNGDRVADLGCGVGVLGILCLEAGASEVWGIDHSDAIHLARETVQRAGLADRYHCIAEQTFRTELPHKVDALICDHVGFFGFDYGIIELLEDARRRFLKPSGVVIPSAMHLFVAAVSSEKSRTLSGAWLEPEIPEQLHWLDHYQRNTRHAVDFSAPDLMSSPSRLGGIDLKIESPELLSFKATLNIEQDGQFHGLAGWFDCELNKGIRMTNSPIEADSIGRRQAFLPVNSEFPVKARDQVEISLKFRRDGTMMTWVVQPPRGAARQKMSTWNSRVLSPHDLVQSSSEPLALGKLGQARAFIASEIDGSRTAGEIVKRVLREMPDLFPTDRATRDFVLSVLARDCEH